jgi:hypothetical protein
VQIFPSYKERYSFLLVMASFDWISMVSKDLYTSSLFILCLILLLSPSVLILAIKCRHRIPYCEPESQSDNAPTEDFEAQAKDRGDSDSRAISDSHSSSPSPGPSSSALDILQPLSYQSMHWSTPIPSSGSAAALIAIRSPDAHIGNSEQDVSVQSGSRARASPHADYAVNTLFRDDVSTQHSTENLASMRCRQDSGRGASASGFSPISGPSELSGSALGSLPNLTSPFPPIPSHHDQQIITSQDMGTESASENGIQKRSDTVQFFHRRGGSKTWRRRVIEYQ